MLRRERTAAAGFAERVGAGIYFALCRPRRRTGARAPAAAADDLEQNDFAKLARRFQRLRDLVPEIHHGLIDAHEALTTALARKCCDPAYVVETVGPMLKEIADAIDAGGEAPLDDLINDMVEATRDLLSGLAMKDLESFVAEGAAALRQVAGGRSYH